MRFSENILFFFVTKFKLLQVIGLYHLGYDMLAENILTYVKDPELLMPPLLAISIQRLKRSLEHSSNQPEWIVSISPNLYKRLQNTVSFLNIFLQIRFITMFVFKGGLPTSLSELAWLGSVFT